LVLIDAVGISPCAKWNATGITVLGTGAAGDASNQLNLPQGLFLHKKTNSLFVADTGNRRVQMLELNQSLAAAQSVVSNVDSLSSVFIDDDGATIYVTLRFGNRLEKWIRGASSGEQVGDQCKQCSSVWLDAERNIYMTESGTHSVLKWSTQTNTSTTVAGRTDQQQQTADHLYFPRGIFVSRTNGTLYIADTMNNRIQKWNRDAQEGTTVAGAMSGVSGRDASTLASPQSVWVDEDTGTVYIADSENDRIQRWSPQQTAGNTIAGGSGIR
jgi:sugar lactone lactonase YvrE